MVSQFSYHICFQNIPVAALSNSKTAPRLNEEEVHITQCIDNNIIVYQLEYLLNINLCKVFKQNGDFWQIGNYLFTVEWPNIKQSLHLIELEDGNYVLWPNELLNWKIEDDNSN